MAAPSGPQEWSCRVGYGTEGAPAPQTGPGGTGVVSDELALDARSELARETGEAVFWKQRIRIEHRGSGRQRRETDS